MFVFSWNKHKTKSTAAAVLFCLGDEVGLCWRVKFVSQAALGTLNFSLWGGAKPQDGVNPVLLQL